MSFYPGLKKYGRDIINTKLKENSKNQIINLSFLKNHYTKKHKFLCALCDYVVNNSYNYHDLKSET